MARSLVLISLAASASALVAPVPAAKSAVAMNYQASEALPFMEKPEALDGTYAGDVGFDPFGFTSIFDVKWLREAEIKHGRICMLAWTGFVATDLGFTLPGDMHQVSSVLAHDVACKYGAMQQLFLWLSFTEVILSAGVAQMMWMGSPREPGDYGLDPLDFCSTPEKKADMKLKEITHCRLAMFAFSGVVTQAVLTGKGFPYF
ncbi:putative plastid light harvesting protein isoform 33 [Aureococcus anophagefferens]|uniref:Putative plastid light harvesting protein isoform 33 n=1 Tax=Aureococcus anophagefferens TaxID=44056 RepID=F0Y5A3_AURAN|nr:putative plastid light harvesting protein isoform 33 [Aureococcus anophagefferens]EGB09834.1 putative plastid light harvesting protein isoform 33 [Aureococcus anophagefferens]|eukprot:XP_009035866.1 putative plastid light harvesting protein isoform 33 [Aureococcus anophagefferens]